MPLAVHHAGHDVVARRRERLPGIVEHLPDRRRVRQRAAVLREVRALLARERVHRDILRPQREHLVDRAAKARRRVRRQPRDQVHVHREAARLAGERERVADRLRGVPAADGLQHAVVHRLGVHADAPNAVKAQNFEFIGLDRVRPPCFRRGLAQR